MRLMLPPEGTSGGRAAAGDRSWTRWKEVEAVSSRIPLTDDTVAFPTLDDSELAVLEMLGTRRSAAVGEGSSAVRSVHEYLAFAH